MARCRLPTVGPHVRAALLHLRADVQRRGPPDLAVDPATIRSIPNPIIPEPGNSPSFDGARSFCDSGQDLDTTVQIHGVATCPRDLVESTCHYRLAVSERSVRTGVTEGAVTIQPGPIFIFRDPAVALHGFERQPSVGPDLRSGCPLVRAGKAERGRRCGYRGVRCFFHPAPPR